ncbi:hypothetical protein ABEB36_001515 [Hypothenemus hampei]|uniref:APCDD1 domain-containing protein n=1 Tax=Hypothenemus hampei TaxID=57062 RepID=A0ABD1FEU0_HYPHA
MVQPGAAAGTIRTVNVTVTPQDDRATRELDRTVSLECPGQTWKAWRKYEEYTVYDQRYDENKKSFKLWMSAHKNTQYSINSKGSNVQISDISCLGSLKWAFNELKLVKILLRPFMEQFRKVSREVKMELLLGDIHSNEKMRQYYKPTSFQAPLVKQLKEPTQIFINRHTYVVKSSQAIPQNLFSNSKTPIHLNEKPHLPAYIWGQWASTRCESRPGGTLYLTRKFFFYPEDASWVGEHNFYSDPFCRIRKFVVTAAGSLLLQQSNDKLKGARNIDFKIKRATMTVQDAKMILDMQLEGHCGVGDWKVNVPKDLSITGGCYRLGIVLPSMQYDVVKVEMDFKGAWLLFLGQVDTDNIQQNDVSRRPTAYQLPLVKCGEIPNYTEDLWEILNDQTYGYSSGHRTEFQWTLYLYFLIWTISILH